MQTVYHFNMSFKQQNCKTYSFFNCKLMKLLRFINEFEIDKIAKRCSVATNFEESQYSLDGAVSSDDNFSSGRFIPDSVWVTLDGKLTKRCAPRLIRPNITGLLGL